MALWSNGVGKPLADASWLEAHHIAKLPERRSFAERLAALNPHSIMDLGCATGLWLDLLNDVMPDGCEFIGVDTDKASLDIAQSRSRDWGRETRFICANLEEETEQLPSADLILAFNVFPYIRDISQFLKELFAKSPEAILAVRQYDGASIRFGPMDTADRQTMESSLRVATESSQHFRHYDMDRTITALRELKDRHGVYSFELFARNDPFTQDFTPYYEQTIAWTSALLPQQQSERLNKWAKERALKHDRYFFEVDLVAIVS